ncbi:cobalamin biosynthesis protein [Streptomyces radicis]|uniref:Cobalamin biosynthesis protein CobD n=1 Tax=Streptomyces radicis TaxID=1750517 RepID=A0A3A9VUQ3_9ACTN|nr:cobalamin biosynthesis protein [Streptomyces radicis]RKN04638.1 cobalamin biosynthesis protein [Streptomyces radicis]RKN15595.1 cobalamin biosynthesis protein [Streptomyces radicis]
MNTSLPAARAAGLLLGFAADRLIGDPRHHHPVAGFGAAASALERRMYADSRSRGLAYAGTLVVGAVLLGHAAARRTERRPLAHAVVTAAATWAVLGGRSLEREALAVHARVERGDLPAARLRLTHLVGRDTAALDEPGIARAVVESVAENTSDAVVAPLVWGAFAGVPGLLGHRAANTLDAMVGHRSPRYARFGWAAARLDDLLNLPGSRLGGLLTAAAAPSRAAPALAVWRADAAAHPSPNAGVVEAAFAGSLGVRLGGTNRYGTRTEHRAVLGNGRPARRADIPRAVVLARRVGAGAALVAAGVALVVGGRGRAR